MIERELDEIEAERTLAEPEEKVAARLPREIWLRRYFDPIEEREMLMCVIVEESTGEIAVVTLFKTSRMARYLRRARL